jgi:hypothetical protein
LRGLRGLSIIFCIKMHNTLFINTLNAFGVFFCSDFDDEPGKNTCIV